MMRVLLFLGLWPFAPYGFLVVGDALLGGETKNSTVIQFSA
jgi:hypothetical protein